MFTLPMGCLVPLETYSYKFPFLVIKLRVFLIGLGKTSEPEGALTVVKAGR